nr:MAG TPA: hypothetical protein [Caudoviricetes sp.]
MDYKAWKDKGLYKVCVLDKLPVRRNTYRIVYALQPVKR